MEQNQGGLAMLILIGTYLVLSVIIGIKADNSRKIGFWGGFLPSFFLTPIIGYIIFLFSKTIEDDKLNKEILENLREQTLLLKDKYDNITISIADEIEKLMKLKNNGLITENEFQEAKQHLINKN